jgi:radical SAM protein with 4Fe4S-binding SPASM domain
MKVREKLYSLLFYNKLAKKLGIRLLNTPWFVNHPLYRYLHDRHMHAVMERYREVPNVVMIENTNLCNARCSMCPHEIMKRPTGLMDFSLYQRLIDQCAAWGVTKVGVHGFGEPLLDRHFAARVQYAKKKGIPHVGTSSNGSLMNLDVAREVILAGLDEINFSLDAFSRAAYEKIRVGLPFAKTMENVAQFVELRQRLQRRKPTVIVDLIEMEANAGESPLFAKKWRGVADKVNITTLHGWGGLYSEKTGQADFHTQGKVVRREPCRFLWTDMVIEWDGRVAACCQDYEAQLIMGDAKTTPLKEIWQGPALKRLREKHRTGRMDEVPLCRGCTYRSVWWLFK